MNLTHKEWLDEVAIGHTRAHIVVRQNSRPLLAKVFVAAGVVTVVVGVQNVGNLPTSGVCCIHNRGNDYEAAYKIDYLDKDRFIRRSWRYMQKSGGSGANKWEKGDRVEFIESFVPDY